MSRARPFIHKAKPDSPPSLLRKLAECKGIAWHAEDAEIRFQFASKEEAAFVFHSIVEAKHGK